MDLGLTGKVALVAGASSGIGKAIAESLAREGANVAIVSRSRGNLNRAVAAIKRSTKRSVYPYVCDVTRKSAVDALVEKISAKLGSVDILICNAGGPPMRRLADMKEADWDDAYRLSLKSTVMLCSAAVPYMKKKKWGRIICITSIVVLQPSETLLLSSTFRPGVHGLTKALSNELAEVGITANVICPGYTRTERLIELAESIQKESGRSVKQVYADWEKVIPMKRLAKPEELGDLAAFLASEKAGYITGVAINIDGGYIKSI